MNNSKKNKINEALEILQALGVPIKTLTQRGKEKVAMALMAIANLKLNDPWSKSAIWEKNSTHQLTTRQIIKFWNDHFDEDVSPGSYDDVRRKDLLLLIEAGIAIKSASDPDANTNNPTRGYAVSHIASESLKRFGSPDWLKCVADFKSQLGSLTDRMERARNQTKVPVTLPNGKILDLSPGPHNIIQKAIIEDFIPRFLPGAEVLYVGDTTKKKLVLEETRLKKLGFFELSHDTLPDVVAYDPKKNWLVLIEAVHSSNPISKLRHLNLERLTENCKAPRIYISAFEDRESLKKWLLDISWETEVWLVDTPSHLIHFNGDKFLGPHPVAPSNL